METFSSSEEIVKLATGAWLSSVEQATTTKQSKQYTLFKSFGIVCGSFQDVEGFNACLYTSKHVHNAPRSNDNASFNVCLYTSKPRTHVASLL
jgi:hypothetical protein